MYLYLTINRNTMKAGNKVKDLYGNIGFIIEIRDNSVLTSIDRNNWFHITKLISL